MNELTLLFVDLFVFIISLFKAKKKKKIKTSWWTCFLYFELFAFLNGTKPQTKQQ